MTRRGANVSRRISCVAIYIELEAFSIAPTQTSSKTCLKKLAGGEKKLLNDEDSTHGLPQKSQITEY
jgi:hypothetical protein